MKFLLSFFTFILTFTSCDSSKKALENSKQMEETLSGTYYINQIGDNDVSSNKIAIHFDEATNKVTGFSGCNNFFGSYNVENNNISFTNIATTKKMCRKDINAIEKQVLKHLNSINTFSIKNDVISFSNNEKVLISGIHQTTPSKKSKKREINYQTSINYKYSSRNSFDYILISKDQILISKDESLINNETFQIETKDWDAINELVETVDLETLYKLTPPSTKHQYDGAPHANLSITVGDQMYMTKTFDHGNPPQAIEDLVNKVLSVKEKLAKQ